MKQRHRSLPVRGLILIAVLLDACTFKVEVLPTSTSSPSAVPAALPASTETPIPSTATAIPASATPTLVPIRAETVPDLETFAHFKVPDTVRSLAFTPDSTVLASALGNDENFSIHLWNVANGEALGTLDGHTDIVWDVAFSPNGELLASVSKDKTAKIWDWQTKTLVKSLAFPGDAVRVRFAPDGQTLAIGGVDEPQNQIQNAAVWIYSVGSWQLVRKFSEYLDITALAYSPKGGILLGGGTSRNVQVWNVNDGAALFTLNHAHQVFRIAISPDGSTVAAATCETVVYPECADGGVWLWNLPTGKLMQKKLTGFPDFVENTAFCPDGSCLVAASRDGTLRFYSTPAYETVAEFISPGGIDALAISPDGGLLAIGNQGEVSLWKIVPHP